MRNLLLTLIQIYILVLIARAVISWFPARPGSGLDHAARALDRVTEPVLAPVRRLLPPMRIGGMGIDLSFIVVLLFLELVLTPIVVRLA
ncbi:MAG: YggT family protein [Acidimicrobiales bacterium]|jgi:YggT family protein